MAADNKLMRQCIQQILNTVILQDAEYLASLHKKALNIKVSVLEIDNLRKPALARALASAENLRINAVPRNIIELKEGMLNGGLTEENLRLCNEALEEIRSAFKASHSKFSTQFYTTIKEIRDYRYELNESDLRDSLENALLIKRKELYSESQWCRNSIVPLLRAIGEAISNVSRNILDLTSQDLFERAINFVPEFTVVNPPSGSSAAKSGSSGTTGSADNNPFAGATGNVGTTGTTGVTTPLAQTKTGQAPSVISTSIEVSAIKYALQVTKECLKELSTGIKVGQLISSNIELNKKRAELQEMYDKSYANIEKIEKNIQECCGLINMMVWVGIYLEETEQLEKDLTDFANRLNQTSVEDYESGKYLAFITEIVKYLKDLNVIWR